MMTGKQIRYSSGGNVGRSARTGEPPALFPREGLPAGGPRRAASWAAARRCLVFRCAAGVRKSDRLTSRFEPSARELACFRFYQHLILRSGFHFRAFFEIDNSHSRFVQHFHFFFCLTLANISQQLFLAAQRSAEVNEALVG